MKIVKLFVVLFVMGLLIYWLTNRMAALPETIKRGNVILQSLEQYKADLGHYPSTLTDLCPKYLEKIPLPVWGLRQWRYVAPRKLDEDVYLGVNEDEVTGKNGSGWLEYLGPELGWQTTD